MSLFVKLSGDLPSIQKSFFRNFVAVIFAAVLLIRSGEGFSFQRRNLPFLIMRSAFGTLGILCNFLRGGSSDSLRCQHAQQNVSFLRCPLQYFPPEGKSPSFSDRCGSGRLRRCAFHHPPFFFQYAAGPFTDRTHGRIRRRYRLCYGSLSRTARRRGPFVVFFFSAFSCLFCLPFLITGYEPMTLYQFAMLMLAGLAAAGGQFTITAAYFYAPAERFPYMTTHRSSSPPSGVFSSSPRFRICSACSATSSSAEPPYLTFSCQNTKTGRRQTERRFHEKTQKIYVPAAGTASADRSAVILLRRRRSFFRKRRSFAS